MQAVVRQAAPKPVCMAGMALCGLDNILPFVVRAGFGGQKDTPHVPPQYLTSSLSPLLYLSSLSCLYLPLFSPLYSLYLLFCLLLSWLAV